MNADQADDADQTDSFKRLIRFNPPDPFYPRSNSPAGDFRLTPARNIYISLSAQLISPSAQLISPSRELISLSRELISLSREPISLSAQPISRGTESFSVTNQYTLGRKEEVSDKNDRLAIASQPKIAGIASTPAIKGLCPYDERKGCALPRTASTV